MEIRYLNELKDVLYDQNWAETAPNLELYYMDRGIEKKDGLRYDVTIIPSQMLGKEFVKTLGHYHKGASGEVYIVLEGEAIYLMQKGKDIIEDVFAIKAQKGDVAIIPPYYGHITINPSGKELKMANWMAEVVQSDYSFIKKMQGACYYFTKDGWIKNKNYKNAPELRFEKPLKSLPEDLGFLKTR